MKKRQIIQKEKEFTEIINKYPYKKNSYFVIYYRQNNEHNRYGISVPKKTGKAHIRNKIKRRIKNIIDQNQKLVHYPLDYVIIIRKRLLELNYQEIEEKLISLINQIGEKNETK
jgi:ribonuclease P protein component